MDTFLQVWREAENYREQQAQPPAWLTMIAVAVGSIYPCHCHADFKELFMLSAEILLSGRRLKLGDYCRTEPDSIHEAVVSTIDCMFIAQAPLHNKFCPAAH
jgi:hypothetical protein